jgi:hypothetical protein
MSFALLLEPWSERIRSFERKRRAHTFICEDLRKFAQ